jgi:HEAT repeat protein
MKIFLSALLSVLLVGLDCSPVFAQDQDDEHKRRLDVLRYGIETQVTELITTLGTEKNKDYAEDLLLVFDSSISPKLQSTILDYYGSLQLDTAVSRATTIIEGRDEAADTLVGSAFSYLLGLKSDAAVTQARRIIEDDERKYLVAAIKMLGVAGKDDDVEILRALYESASSDAGIKQEILLAFGKMRALSSFDLLESIASADDAGKIERMYACTALGDLGDSRAIPVLIGASVVADPNIRASALSALQNFDDKTAENAILQGLRDQHVIPRLAAVKAVGKRELKAALPFLEFRIKFDPERSIKDASIEVLASIGGKAGLDFLSSFLEDTKSPLAHRASAFVAILSHGDSSDIERAMAVLEKSATEKDKAVFTALARASMASSAPQAVHAARFLLSNSDHLIRLGALAWAERNKAADLLPELKAMAESDPAESLRKRVLITIERIGIP